MISLRKPFQTNLRRATPACDEPPTSPGRLGAPLVVSEGEQIEIEWVKLIATRSRTRSGAMQELQKHNTFFALKYKEGGSGGSAAVTDSSIRMSNIWQADDLGGPLEVTGVPPINPRSAKDDPAPLALQAWTVKV